MQVRSGLRPISLSRSTVLFVGLFILVVLPIVLAFAFSSSIYAFYLSEIVAPELESSLGFKGGYVRVGDAELYALVSVDPKGPFGRAGAKPGDIPCRYVHGIEPGFLGHLHESRGQQVSLFLCNGKDWSEKRVTLMVPKRAV